MWTFNNVFLLYYGVFGSTVISNYGKMNKNSVFMWLASEEPYGGMAGSTYSSNNYHTASWFDFRQSHE